MNNKVYILIDYYYDDFEIFGAFLDIEDANREKERLFEENNDLCLEVVETELK